MAQVLMRSLPFDIPKSLSSFVQRFEKDPEQAIEKLSSLLKKRGPDSVGYFLLAWFFYSTGNTKQAVKEALKAKAYAPGSPLMEYLPYFLNHPESFEARLPKTTSYTAKTKLTQVNRSPKHLDLDHLITLLEEVESKRIRIPELISGSEDEVTDLSADSEQVEDIMTETLAKIHAGQGRKKEAIAMFERLIESNPESSRKATLTDEVKRLMDND
ncbi:MAG: tetratricopeptide repeat protein [Bacteroidota bacterium]